MSIRTATASDLDAVSGYLARTLKGGSPSRYRSFLDYSWMANKPDIGVLLEEEGQIRGFVGAIYSERRYGNAVQRLCNLTSISVDESHRRHTLQLLGALFKDKSLTFTSFSASDRAAKIFQFFKFSSQPSDKVIIGPPSGLAGLRNMFGQRTRVVTGTEALDVELDPEQRAISRDHARYRCGQLLLVRGDRRCFVVTVRRGRGVRAFADVLHASDPELLMAHLPWIQIPVFRAHGTLLVGINRTWVNEPPRLSFIYSRLRATYWRSSTVRGDQIDALYSELVPMYGRTE